jgi:hypothetical protein
LRGTFVSAVRDVVPLSAIICAIGESNSGCRPALKNDSHEPGRPFDAMEQPPRKDARRHQSIYN